MSRADIPTQAAIKTQRGDGFSIITILLILFLGLASFGAFFALSGFAGDFESKSAGRANAISKSPNGYAGIVRLLSESGIETELFRDIDNSDKWFNTLEVYTLQRSGQIDGLEDISVNVPRLIVLPKWSVGRSQHKPGMYQRYGLVGRNALAENLSAFDETLDIARDDDVDTYALNSETLSDFGFVNGLSTTLDSAQTISGTSLVPIVKTGEKIVLGRIKDTDIYILSDPDLLANSGLKDLTGARIGYNLLVSLAKSISVYDDGETTDPIIHFDLTIHGMGTNNNLIKVMLLPPFLAATLCLLAVGLLIGWRAFSRFGAPIVPLRVFALGKQALAENSADLIRLAGREPNMAPGYAALIRKLTAKSVRVPKTLGDNEVLASLDRIGKRSGASESLKALSETAPQVTTNTELMSFARKLYKWRQEITNDHI